jgi:hypothetical protein
MAGAVFSGEKKLAKAGDVLAEDAPLEVRGKDHPWASRGGIKLDHGLTHFGFDVTGAVALDVGSSTGGFADVLLTRGAAKVYAVDVGTGVCSAPSATKKTLAPVASATRPRQSSIIASLYPCCSACCFDRVQIMYRPAAFDSVGAV